jgi:hypothetical protein
MALSFITGQELIVVFVVFVSFVRIFFEQASIEFSSQRSHKDHKDHKGHNRTSGFPIAFMKHN